MRHRLWVASALVASAIVLTAVSLSVLQRVHCLALARSIDADGEFHAVAILSRRFGRTLSKDELSSTGAPAPGITTRARPDGTVVLFYRAPLNGGDVRLHVSVGRQEWLLPEHAVATWTDHVGDGYPDSLRLHSAEDRGRFRHWFTTLADRAAAMPDHELPAEITDCSALLRYAYRLTMVRHDDRWYKQFAPGTVPVLPSVEQWNYPDTPLGAGLFRVLPPDGAIQSSDFAEFADARTLYGRNSFRVGRDVRIARSGDLLFFHQLEEDQQYHSMIVTGEGGAWVVYHTGPSGTGASRRPGQMRRARLTDLLHHPDPRWRPSVDNPNFLGVFRWNLLRED